MKKVVILICVLALGLTMMSCGKKCDICGSTDNVETMEYMGEEANFCDKCVPGEYMDAANELLDALS